MSATPPFAAADSRRCVHCGAWTIAYRLEPRGDRASDGYDRRCPRCGRLQQGDE